MTFDEVLSHFRVQKRDGNKAMIFCPVHPDGTKYNKASLSATFKEGKTLLNCFAGCDTDEVVKAAGITISDLFAEPISNGRSKTLDEMTDEELRQELNNDEVEAVYPYPDEKGNLLFEFVRYFGKDFKVRRVNPANPEEYVYKLDGVRRILYRLPKLLEAKALGLPLFIVEGEKDCDNLQRLLGESAIITTNPFGAGKWRDEYSDTIRDFAKVFLVRDNDRAGEQHVSQIGKSLSKQLGTREIRLIEFPALQEGGDVSDWIAKGHTREEFQQLVEAAPIWKPIAKTKEKNNPWLLAKAAPVFLSEQDKEFVGIVKDLVSPETITIAAAPRGLGKSLVAMGLAVCLAKGQVFREEQLRPCKVLYFDRDNPKATIKDRLRRFGAAEANNLYILTRENAPALKNAEVWKNFPIQEYDVLFIDSAGSSTEGVTEKEGKETTEVLATLRDLAARKLAIVILCNTIKSGENVKGRGEWEDRADILYEVRDATGFKPTGGKPWWEELPPAGAAAWAERATRRKGRDTHRLAFVASKFRPGIEPEPFCLEVSTPATGDWSVRDVSADLVQESESAASKAIRAKEEQAQNAIETLKKVVCERHSNNDPIGKTEATELLRESGFSRDKARAFIEAGDGSHWNLHPARKGEGKQGAFTLLPFSKPEGDRNGNERDGNGKIRGSEVSVVADPMNIEPQRTDRENANRYREIEKSQFVAEDGSAKGPDLVTQAVFSNSQVPLCRFLDHRGSDWTSSDGVRLCGVCRPKPPELEILPEEPPF